MFAYMCIVGDVRISSLLQATGVQYKLVEIPAHVVQEERCANIRPEFVAGKLVAVNPPLISTLSHQQKSCLMHGHVLWHSQV